MTNIVGELPAWIQRLCEDTFGVDNKESLFSLAVRWQEFFDPKPSKEGVLEPYDLSEELRVAFTYKYLLFGISASKHRLTLRLNQTQPDSTKFAGGLNQAQPDSTGLNRTQPDSTGLNRTQPDSTGLNRTQPDSTGLNQAQPN